MFFQNRITLIKPTDKVLEIGPGASPFYRSDVLLEKQFDDDSDYEKQFGHAEKLVTDKKIIFYKGEIFPFQDKEFDYVICSHVLEHVENIPQFLSEVFRVAKKGYFEYPLMYYEYLYNYEVHKSFLKFDGAKLHYMYKKDSPLNVFQPIQLFFNQTQVTGHGDSFGSIIEYFMEGFEWSEPFDSVETSNLNDLAHKNLLLPMVKRNVGDNETIIQLIKKIVKKIIR